MDGRNLRSRSVKRYFESTSEEDEDSGGEGQKSDKEEVETVKIVARPKRKSSKSSAPIVTTPTPPRRNAVKKTTRQSTPNQKKLMKGGYRSIASYFGGKIPAEQSKEEHEREQKKRKLDEETRAFLTSGLPQAVIRAQKAVEKRKEEDDYLSRVGFFPKITRVGHEDDVTEEPVSNVSAHPTSFKVLAVSTEEDEDEEDYKVGETSKLSRLLHSARQTKSKRIWPRFCCPSFEMDLNRRTKGSAEKKVPDGGIPWIEKYKVEHLEDLVVDKEPLKKLTKWLKQWKSDISDDGGASRKLVEKKRRRRDSESDYESTDEEENEIKSKSVLLAGPSGCGKTAAVYVTAKHYGFHVIEVSFSSRRSGKETMQRVEEAVSSHRLESTSNCLLLFKDIELMDGEEDEGFYAAVAKLITTAVRPIVMTTSSLSIPLDSKIDKKEPLRILFEPPRSYHLIKKVLMPIIMNEVCKGKETSKERLQDVKRVLSSVVSHARCDIRHCINQTQFLFGGAGINSQLVHQNSIQPEGLIDLNFILPTHNCNPDDDEEESEEDAVNVTLKCRKKKDLKALDTVCESLSFLTDLDFVNGLRIVKRTNLNDHDDLVENEIKRLKSSYFDRNFRSTMSLECGSAGSSKPPSLEIMQRLSLSSQQDSSRGDKIMMVSQELSEYFDSGNVREEWESASALRTIVKMNAMTSVTRLAKRNGRMTSYFNRLDKSFVERICDSFGYSESLEEAKDMIRNSTNNNFF